MSGSVATTAMNHVFSSPLKAVQGSAIIDLTAGQFGSPKFGRSPSPHRRPASLSYSHSSFTSSSKPPRLEVVNVLIPTKPKYVPNQRPPQLVLSSQPSRVPGQTQRSHKVIISRFLLVNGHISFVVGTQLDGVVTPDTDEVPVAKILDYISPAELERFENQDFFDEDEKERLLPPPKPRGRPPKNGGIVPTFNIAPVGKDTSREQSLLPDGSVSLKKKVGRPKGWRKGDTSDKKADRLTSKKQSLLAQASTGTKKARGRPPRQKNLSIVIPSFNGPQPQELENLPDAESESDEMLDTKPQYSMITASGLVESDTEDMTSRDQSVELGPAWPSKKRPLDTSSAFVDRNSDLDTYTEGESPHPNKRVRTLSETSPDPIADDSAALLRQFQARVYGPDDFAKSSTIPHRRSKTSPTLEDSAALLRQFNAHTRSSSAASSSSDSLMGPTPRSNKPSPAQFIASKPLPGEPLVSQHPSPKVNSAGVPTLRPNNSITVSDSSQRQPAKATTNKSAWSSTYRKLSLTPHFPPCSTSLSHKSPKGSAESKPPSHLSSGNRPAPLQPTKTTFSQSSRTIPSPPKKRKPSPPIPRSSAPSQLSQVSSTSKIGFAGVPRAKDLTDYFAPKATAVNTAPLRQTRHSPTSQLLGPDDSESEDQLARKSSSDSLGSEIIAVPPSRPPPNSQARQSSSSDSLGSAIIAVPLNHSLHPANNQTRQSSSFESLGSEIIARPLIRAPHPHPHPHPYSPTTTTTSQNPRPPSPPNPQPSLTAPSSSTSSTSSNSLSSTIFISRNAAAAAASHHAPTTSSSEMQIRSSADALSIAFEMEGDEDDEEEEEEEGEESSSETESEESEDDSMGSEVMVVRAG